MLGQGSLSDTDQAPSPIIPQTWEAPSLLLQIQGTGPQPPPSDPPLASSLGSKSCPPVPRYIAALEEDGIWLMVLETTLKMVRIVMLGFPGRKESSL